MSCISKAPFDGIESAHEFLVLLCQTVAEARNELDTHVARQAENPSRRLDALRVSQYKLERLQEHLNRSTRLLNDLRSLRRLVFEERAAPIYKSAPAPIPLAEPVAAAESLADGAEVQESELVAA